MDECFECIHPFFLYNIVMKIYTITINTILLICLPLIASGQNNHCYINTEDTTKCYVTKQYVKPKIVLEKKWQTKETTAADQIPLFADIDGDCLPEIVLQGRNQTGGSIPDTPRVHFYNGSNGNLKVKFDCIGFDPYLKPVIADLDNDGISEIIVASYNGWSYWAGFILCYEFTGKLKWKSDEYFYNRDYNPQHTTFGVADFNQDGKPEVYCTNRIFNGQTGKLLAEGGMNGIGATFVNDGSGKAALSVTVAANLDSNTNDLELAAGYTIYKVKLNNLHGKMNNQMTPINIKIGNHYFDGITAISDVNMDGHLDVIVSSAGKDIKSKLYAYTLLNETPILISQNYIPGKDERNGCPSIADIDGNGIPDILVSKFNLIHNFEYDGTSILKLKWSLKVRDTLASTGITTFDLNGDGIQEIIYRDQSNLLIIDGSVSPPQIIDSIGCIAGTFFEYPVIVDADQFGKSLICVICSDLKNGLGRLVGNLTTFGSPDSLPGWAPARAVWNQYAYNPLYINDDLTVPRVPKNQATYKNGKYNNFLQQESLLDSNGMYKVAAANLWGEIDCIDYDPVAGEFTVTFNVFNHKKASAGVDGALPVSFYNGDPATSGSIMGIYHTQVPLDPGDSLVHQEFKFKASQINDLYMVVNTRRDTSGVFDPKDFSSLECDYADNVFHTTEFPKIQRISASICKGSTYPFYDSLLIEQGIYVHTLYNQKGCDSLIALLELAIVDTVHSLQTLSVCDSFNLDGIVYRENGTFVNHFQTSAGCDSVVTLNLSVRHSSDTLIHKTACRKFDFNDKVYTEGGHYFIKLRNRQGCDSTIELNLSIVALDTNVTKLNNTLTALDSLATYQWVDCDGDYAPVVNATERSYTPVRSGNYGVILSYPPCSDTTVCIQVIVTHAFNEDGYRCMIYPNPTSGKLYVQLPERMTGDLILTICDIQGRELIQRSLARGGREFIEVDVGGWVEGVYFISIQSALVSDQFIFYKMGMGW
ncbi:MAG: hypothetical protein JPMHGGIA_01459 [Saprospiraceae bacterium]|nr:hypothetical protein [Saprospiraceae bacterium]